MAGFPPVDTLYYESPSIRIFGSMALALTKLQSKQLNVIPGQGYFPSTPPQDFDSLQDVMAHLKQEHQSSHYYRGQTKRHDAKYKGRVERLAQHVPHVDQLEVRFESLVPSVFRVLTKDEFSDWSAYQPPKLLDQIASAVRAILHSDYKPIKDFLIEFFREELRLIGIRNLGPKVGWNIILPLEFTTITGLPHNFLRLISLAQHYEYQSTMVDITSSVDVAAWFASHEWDGRTTEKSAPGRGVIYRFDYAAINDMLKKELYDETPVKGQIASSGLFGLADISNLGDEFGFRPKHQVGGSFFGFENSSVYLLLDAYSALEIFTFPLSSVTGSETTLTKSYLCPPNDPMLNVFTDAFRNANQPITTDELMTVLDKEDFTAQEKSSLKNLREEGLI